MNGSWIEPPPPKGMGCFAKGCLTCVAFFVLLAVAFVGGTFLAVRVLRTSYFSTAQAQLPVSTATESEQAAARAKWTDFERAARARVADRIEMTAEELNALIAAEPEARGKAFVTIEGDSAHLQISVPLEDFRLLRGRYMNADCTVQSAPDGKLAHARITSVLVNGKPVGEDVLNWTGPWGFRRYIGIWADKSDINSFQIADGKVILETREAATP